MAVVQGVRSCGGAGNVLEVRLADGTDRPPHLEQPAVLVMDREATIEVDFTPTEDSPTAQAIWTMELLELTIVVDSAELGPLTKGVPTTARIAIGFSEDMVGAVFDLRCVVTGAKGAAEICIDLAVTVERP